MRLFHQVEYTVSNVLSTQCAHDVDTEQVAESYWLEVKLRCSYIHADRARRTVEALVEALGSVPEEYCLSRSVSHAPSCLNVRGWLEVDARIRQGTDVSAIVSGVQAIAGDRNPRYVRGSSCLDCGEPVPAGEAYCRNCQRPPPPPRCRSCGEIFRGSSCGCPQL